MWNSFSERKYQTLWGTPWSKVNKLTKKSKAHTSAAAGLPTLLGELPSLQDGGIHLTGFYVKLGGIYRDYSPQVWPAHSTLPFLPAIIHTVKCPKLQDSISCRAKADTLTAHSTKLGFLEEGLHIFQHHSAAQVCQALRMVFYIEPG